MKLVIGGEVADSRLVAVGEVSPPPEVFDGLSLTFLGVVASVALALAFGIQGLSTIERVVLGVGVFVVIALALRRGPVRRGVLRFARWALADAHDHTA